VVVHEEFIVDIEAGTTVGMNLDTYVVPVVGLQEMCRISIFLQNGRAARRVCYSKGIALIPAESGCSIIVASIAEVIALKTIALNETPLALGYRG